MKRLLIVDDDRDILDSLKLLLELRYELCLARNGSEALLELERGYPADAILLDLMMPVVDGAEFLAELKRRGIEKPVLVISAHPETAMRAKGLGVEDYIVKPFTYEQLKQKIERLLDVGRGTKTGGFLRGFFFQLAPGIAC
jgi:DNA-binding response OmpR family regulator